MKKLLVKVIFTFAFMAFCGTTANAEEKIPEDFCYVVRDGSVYYESSDRNGRSAVVNVSNPYTTFPCYAGLDGYSYLDEKGMILISKYNPDTNSIKIPEAPEGAALLCVHFKTARARAGWVNAEDIINL